MKFSSYQKIVLGYNTIVDMLQKRGFDTNDLEAKCANITEDLVDIFLTSYQTKSKTQEGGYDSDGDGDDSYHQTAGADEHKGATDDESEEEEEEEGMASNNYMNNLFTIEINLKYLNLKIGLKLPNMTS